MEPSKEKSTGSSKTNAKKPEQASFFAFSNRVAFIGMAGCIVVYLWHITMLEPLASLLFAPLAWYWALVNGLPLLYTHRKKCLKMLAAALFFVTKGIMLRKRGFSRMQMPPHSDQGGHSWGEALKSTMNVVPKMLQKEPQAVSALPYLVRALPMNPKPDGSRPMTSEQASMKITNALRSSGFQVEEPVRILDITSGPTLQQIAFELPPKIQLTQLMSQQVNLANHLGIESGFDILNPDFPSSAGFTIPHNEEGRSYVYMRDVMEPFLEYAKTAELPVILGKDINGKPVFFDLAKLPHLLIAGGTGSGKSVFINDLILSLGITRNEEQLKFLMVDPKMVELSPFNGMPHLLEPVITDMSRVEITLNKIVEKMDRQYEVLMAAGVRNIASYNKKMAALGKPLMPYHVIIIDEYSDLKDVIGDNVDDFVKRLAQKARAVGIHLVLGTQSPRADIITGPIKANIPGRICFAVSGALEYRIVMDSTGEVYPMLMGRGDGMAKVGGNKKIRFQSAAPGNDDESPLYIAELIRYYKEQRQAESVEPELEEDVLDVGEDVEPVPAAVPETNKVEVTHIPDPLPEEKVRPTVPELAPESVDGEPKGSPVPQKIPAPPLSMATEETEFTPEQFEQAVRIVEENGRITSRQLELRLQISRTLAIQLVKQMMADQIIGPMDHESGSWPIFDAGNEGQRRITNEELYDEVKRIILRERQVRGADLQAHFGVRKQRISDVLQQLTEEGFLLKSTIGSRISYTLNLDEEDDIPF